jgi:hypothetical protein
MHHPHIYLSSFRSRNQVSMDCYVKDLTVDQQNDSSRRHVLVVALEPTDGYYGLFLMPEDHDHDRSEHLFGGTVETPADDQIIMYHPDSTIESLVTTPAPFLSALVSILFGMAATVGFHNQLVMATHVALSPEEFVQDLKAKLRQLSPTGPEGALRTMSVMTLEDYFGKD